ncbi:MAG: heme exporter protein CcmB [Vicingaceae bacterium]
MVAKDLKTELRNRTSINGILLYVVSTVFVAYLIFNQIEEMTTWIALFWIVLLFASTNASMQSFKAESGRQFYFYYSLCSPQSIILAKLIFNGSLLLLIALVNWLLFTVLLGNPIENSGIFFLVLLFGSLGFSGVLTLVSGIASKTNNNSTLTAILAFPIMLPMLLTAVKASMLSGLGFGWDECGTYIALMALINVVIIALAYVLFPYLWRS